jgi:hypothetical protein
MRWKGRDGSSGTGAAESPAEDFAEWSGPSVMPAIGAEVGEEFVGWAVGSVESLVES